VNFSDKSLLPGIRTLPTEFCLESKDTSCKSAADAELKEKYLIWNREGSAQCGELTVAAWLRSLEN
jgi:hypothetical protein